MYYPHSVKKTVTDGKTGKKSEKTEYGVRNSLVRENFVKSFGEERFNKLCETESRYQKYALPKFPKGYDWIWNQFMFIWSNCEHDFNGNTIFTFQTVNEYEKCMKVHFSVVEKKLLFNMKQWVCETISELNQ